MRKIYEGIATHTSSMNPSDCGWEDYFGIKTKDGYYSLDDFPIRFQEFISKNKGVKVRLTITLTTVKAKYYCYNCAERDKCAEAGEQIADCQAYILGETERFNPYE